MLQQMHEYFSKPGSEQKVFLLYGLGGIGKTQVALKFMEEARSL
jgi:Cdc6-like AAA superfamily ATPase